MTWGEQLARTFARHLEVVVLSLPGALLLPRWCLKLKLGGKNRNFCLNFVEDQ